MYCWKAVGAAPTPASTPRASSASQVSRQETVVSTNSPLPPPLISFCERGVGFYTRERGVKRQWLSQNTHPPPPLDWLLQTHPACHCCRCSRTVTATATIHLATKSLCGTHMQTIYCVTRGGGFVVVVAVGLTWCWMSQGAGCGVGAEF